MRYVKVVNSIALELEGWLPGVIGEKKEWLFKGYRVSVLQDEKVLKICFTIHLTLLNTLKNG